MKITKAIHDKQKTKVWNDYFIKVVKKYQYTNCNKCTNGTNFNEFFFCLSYVGSGYFSFYAKCIPIMIFSTLSFSILILFTDCKWSDPCRATLVFTPSEIY